MPRRLALIAALIAIALLFAGNDDHAHAQTGWSITSFNVMYTIDKTGTVAVAEDIAVDFGSEQHHGIFRDMPVRYAYDDQYDRKIDVTNTDVRDAGGNPVRFDTSSSGPNLRITIGNPDVLVSGRQEYKISYLLTGALNPFADHDEFFGNVTGNGWEVPIEQASATVASPASAIQNIQCFQGPEGTQDPCQSSFTADGAEFRTTLLAPGEGLTFVIGMQKGAVTVAPPVLVGKLKGAWAKAFVINPITVGIMLIGILAVLIAVARLWWVQGRDRWLGDKFYLNETPSTPEAESTRPLMAHETIVFESTPPELDGTTKRRLRPVEIGVLLDERADTLDVSATIVDLAVRKHMTIAEEKAGGVFGLFKKKDYELNRLTTDAGDLLPYETQLKDALFDTGDTVTLSSLKNKFHSDLEKVKAALYKQATDNGFFPSNPETMRHLIRIAGIVVGVLGGAMVYGFGALFGGGLIGVPLIVAGVLLLFTAGAFPRRTGNGRVLFRRSLGFWRFMVESDKAREKFAENANIFHDYLPYAIVYGCVERWAKVFKGLGLDPGTPSYYVGTGPFIAASFADSMTSFSSSISSAMASTPGGSGGSGFGGGSGGGGGGGGGAW
ncbi:MAG TPA: DUF2207 domain-containing protein [Dehalococcoidia bacterium]